MEEERGFHLDPARLHLRGSFNKQVAEVLRYIRMPFSRLNKVKKIIAEFENRLNNLYEGCRVKKFGSILMGLALRTSDVDCFVEGCNEDPDICIQRTVAQFNEHPHIFKNVQVITNKKLSVITFFHTGFKMSCDLSFSGPRAVNIGELVSHMLQLDTRAWKLTMLIKYWAKIHQISGTKLLPSNGLIFLVIFFLQQKNILPTVASLQENQKPRIIDEWNVAFEPIQEHPSDNRDTLYQLLGEFFQYYSRFDFTEQIVSPYLGKPVPRRNFLHIKDVPSPFTLYKKIGNFAGSITVLSCLICVQCPFEHGRNIAIAVKRDLANKIIGLFRRAADAYETCYDNSTYLRLILQEHTLSINFHESNFQEQASGSLDQDRKFCGEQREAAGHGYGSRGQPHNSHQLRGQRRIFRGHKRGSHGQALHARGNKRRTARSAHNAHNAHAWEPRDMCA